MYLWLCDSFLLFSLSIFCSKAVWISGHDSFSLYLSWKVYFSFDFEGQFCWTSWSRWLWPSFRAWHQSVLSWHLVVAEWCDIILYLMAHFSCTLYPGSVLRNFNCKTTQSGYFLVMCIWGSKLFLYLDVHFFPWVWENFNNFTEYAFCISVFSSITTENETTKVIHNKLWSSLTTVKVIITKESNKRGVQKWGK